ncbi:MAG: GAF domain-containing SpoIIE family protein phosphatase [Opitutaceae bacterium]|jgi:sigma-B regulation protein RsbU (phosphoserine phosphatase)
MSFLFLGLGFLVGILAMLLLLVRTRAAADRLDEQRQILAQENRIVLDFMHQMAEALADNPSRNILYQRIVHAAILSTGALSACIFEKTSDDRMHGLALEGLFPPHRPLPEQIRDKLTTRTKFIEQVLRSETFPVGEGIVGRVAATGRGELIADAAADPRIVHHDDPALAVKSVIAVPLLFRDRFFGVLAVTNPADGLPFSATDFSLVQSLAEQAALALHNAEFLNFQIEKSQLDLDLSLASGIQKMLLPHTPPRLAGLDVDARYLPAQKIGGDLYDLFALSDSKLGVAVADVSGKGIAASLLMAICRANLRQIAPRHGSPAGALIELNRALSGDLQRETFVTMSYAVVDVAAGTVTFARAGHELALFVRRDRVSGLYLGVFSGGEGMPLGLVDESFFSEVITDRVEPFDPGDVLVLYTDGVTEAPNEEQKEFSGSRLADVVRALRDRSAREINDGILENVQRFSEGVEQRDDFTLVTVKRV